MKAVKDSELEITLGEGVCAGKSGDESTSVRIRVVAERNHADAAQSCQTNELSLRIPRQHVEVSSASIVRMTC